MIRLLAILLLSSLAPAQNQGPMDGGIASAPPCVAPTMTYRWTPTSGCSTSTPCATDQVSGNNASQTSSGALPTYGATCGPNSTPCLTFNGSSDYIVPTTAIPANPTAFTLYAVMEATTVSVHNPLFGGNNSGISFKVDPSNVMDLSVQGVSDAFGSQTIAASTWYTQVVTYDNGTTTGSFYAASGGGLTAHGSGSAAGFTATTPNLGGIPLQGIFFTGNIAEWGYLNSVSTAGIANWSSCHYGV
jgi:hypothetical protein